MADPATRANGNGNGAIPFVGVRRSLSATPRWRAGESEPDEYVAQIRDPVKRMEVFDQMGQGDDAIGAAVQTRIGMLKAANWTLAASDDSPESIQRLEFIEDNLYPLLDQLLGMLGEAIQYGFAAVEPIVNWADRAPRRNIARGTIVRPTRQAGRMLYLQELVHIRQRTVRSFLLDAGGHVTALRQWAYSGVGYGAQAIDVPAASVILHTVGKRGDDFWGNPPTRRAYKPWTFKNQLERLNLVGAERFGVGIPVAEAGENWKSDDYAKLATFLEGFQSNNNTYLVHPAGGKINILTANGQLVANVLEWVKYYTLAIHFQFLTHGTQLASNTDTGARALGDTFVDQAASASQAECEDIASLINDRLIVPLVDANFGPQADYPIFAPSQRVMQSSQFAATLSTLKGAGMLTWGPREEVYLRDAYELPEVSIEELEKMAAERAAVADAIRGQGPGPTDPPPPDDTPPDQPPTPVAASRAVVLSQHELPVAADVGMTHRTERWSAWEDTVIRPANLGRDLDVETARLSGEVQAVLREIDIDLAAQAGRVALGGSEGVAERLATIRVSPAMRNRLRAVLAAAAERSRAMGKLAVANEVARQAMPDVARPARFARWLSRFLIPIDTKETAPDA